MCFYLESEIFNIYMIGVVFFFWIMFPPNETPKLKENIKLNPHSIFNHKANIYEDRY